MTTRGVPKPKNPTTLAALEKQDDNSGSLLGAGAYMSNDPNAEAETEKQYKPPITAASMSGIGKGTASITDVKARQHQRLGITPAPAYGGPSRSAPPITGYF